jgi:hypothetical protein
VAGSKADHRRKRWQPRHQGDSPIIDPAIGNAYGVAGQPLQHPIREMV